MTKYIATIFVHKFAAFGEGSFVIRMVGVTAKDEAQAEHLITIAARDEYPRALKIVVLIANPETIEDYRESF